MKHPLRPVSDADLQYQWDLASRIRDKVNEANGSVIKIRRIKNDITERTKDAPKEVQDAGAKLTQSLAAIEEEIYQVRNQSGQDPLNFPIKTNNRLASLLRVAVSGEGRPTNTVESIFADLIAELRGHTDRLDKTLASDLAAFNRMLTRIKRDFAAVKRRREGGASAPPRDRQHDRHLLLFFAPSFISNSIVSGYGCVR
jgi:hypothetical protein